jgi:hypothetical protein
MIYFPRSHHAIKCWAYRQFRMDGMVIFYDFVVILNPKFSLFRTCFLGYCNCFLSFLPQLTRTFFLASLLNKVPSYKNDVDSETLPRITLSISFNNCCISVYLFFVNNFNLTQVKVK